MNIGNDHCSEISSDRLRHTHFRPPTPPRPSQKWLGEEEGEAQWDDDGSSVQIPPTPANDVGWSDGGTEEGASGNTSNYKIRNKKVTAMENSQVDDGEEADDYTKGEDSPWSNRLYTQEELVILTRNIFEDEEEEEDG